MEENGKQIQKAHPAWPKRKKTDNPEKDEVNYLALNKQSSSQN